MPDYTQLPLFNQNNSIEILLTRGYVTFVDSNDSDLSLFKWFVVGNRYAGRHLESKVVYMHRIILSRMVGRELVAEEHTDHISGDTFDNRRSNLRIASRTQNMRNTKRPVTNTSGYKGVYWHKAAQKWLAQIVVNGKWQYLGLHETPELAYAAYCEAAKHYFGEFARLE